MPQFKITVTKDKNSYSFTMDRPEAPSENEIRDTLDHPDYPRSTSEIEITEMKV